jgi:hypothetical protein
MERYIHMSTVEIEEQLDEFLICSVVCLTAFLEGKKVAAEAVDTVLQNDLLLVTDLQRNNLQLVMGLHKTPNLHMVPQISLMVGLLNQDMDLLDHSLVPQLQDLLPLDNHNQDLNKIDHGLKAHPVKDHSDLKAQLSKDTVVPDQLNLLLGDMVGPKLLDNQITVEVNRLHANLSQEELTSMDMGPLKLLL